jgi:hypothetical protein
MVNWKTTEKKKISIQLNKFNTWISFLRAFCCFKKYTLQQWFQIIPIYQAHQ